MRFKLVVFGLVTALLVACGGGDDDDGNNPSTGGGGSNSPGASTGATGGGGSTGGATTNNDDDDDDGADIADDCPALLALIGTNPFAGATGPDLEDFDAEFFRDAADRAPDEIKEDMEVLADAVSEFFDKLEELEVDFSNPSSFASLSADELAELEEASAVLDSPELEEANANVTAYLERECN